MAIPSAKPSTHRDPQNVAGNKGGGTSYFDKKGKYNTIWFIDKNMFFTSYTHADSDICTDTTVFFHFFQIGRFEKMKKSRERVCYITISMVYKGRNNISSFLIWIFCLKKGRWANWGSY